MSAVSRTALASMVGAVLLVSSCGGGESAEEKAKEQFTAAADESTCLADATEVAKPWPDGFPDGWPFPDQTTVYNVEDRGSDGTIVTAVTGSPFKDVLAQFNGEVADAGYQVESGETEEHDAEAEWGGNGYRGRWAIRESSSCPGETVIQILSAKE